MAQRQVSINVRPGFQLRARVFSHGWYDLPPFAWDAQKHELTTAVLLDHMPVTLCWRQRTQNEMTALVTYGGRWLRGRDDRIVEITRTVFALDHDVDQFYQAFAPEYAWAAAIDAGPFLRCPTIFEDITKLYLTTNCSWAATRGMVTRLVHELGMLAPGGLRTFPTPEAIAALSVEELRQRFRVGYRASTLHTFASAVGDGTLDLESWTRTDRPTADLVEEITRIKGFGRYVAENLCRLLGRFDGLGLDSWCLKKFPEVFGPVSGSVEEEIRRRYERFGCWRGLALWLDLTQDWHSDAIAETGLPFRKR